ncbi:MAG: HTH-type transcriptional regulator YesS [Firmicutes bacterium ADurb.Bin193]|nr:MAG: HTH-type transcriptional regulator YesS [Firmicutes bacterium ADurb.Bin193]
MEDNRDNLRLMQTIERQLKQFSVATGVNCVCVPRDDEGFNYEEGCKICKTINEITQKKVDCKKAITYGAYQAERFGGKYIFYCPMGLTYFASPVFSEGSVFAVAVGGPVLLVDKNEYVSEDIISRLGIEDCYEHRIKKDIRNVPRVSPERVTAMSQTLFCVCSFISGTKQLQYLTDEETIGNDMAKYINFISTMGGKPYESSYPIQKERELLSLISVGDREKAQEILDDILKHIIEYSNLDFENAKARILELAVLLSRAALEGGADLEQIFGINYKFLNRINQFKTVAELSHWLSDIMVRFTDCVFNIVNIKHMDTIYKAVDYIKRNYSRKITLEEVAGHVFLSPSYFSKVFKEELKISFNNYLNQIRIENSKRLLLNDNIDMIKVSEMSGFEEQSYYIKVFKKITGVTPGQYRRRYGK